MESSNLPAPFIVENYSRQDLLYKWQGSSPEFEDEQGYFDYLISMDILEMDLFHALIERTLNESIELLSGILAEASSQVVQYVLLEKLITLKEDYQATGYSLFGIINCKITQARAQVLIEFLKTKFIDFREQNFRSIDDFINQMPMVQRDIPIKDFLMWANMPFILWPNKLSNGFTKTLYFKFLGKFFGVKTPKNPASNIIDAIKEGTLHESINNAAASSEFVNFIQGYKTAFDNDQEKRAERKRQRHFAHDSKIDI